MMGEERATLGIIQEKWLKKRKCCFKGKKELREVIGGGGQNFPIWGERNSRVRKKQGVYGGKRGRRLITGGASSERN